MNPGEAGGMDRSIPHVRDIFAPYRSSSHDSSHDNRIHVYQHSPGNRRRRHEPKMDLPPQDFIDTDHSDSTDEGPDNNNRERVRSRHNNNNHNNNNRNSCGDLLLQDRNNEANSNRTGGGGYSSKTLTERDIRHLERHLSMKKTIRKQISRNLAQAFVDDPAAVLLPGLDQQPQQQPQQPQQQQQQQQQSRQQSRQNDCSFTLTRAKMAARSEHTLLDMLKKDSGSGRGPGEADSGHSSPSHQGGFDDEPPMSMDLDYDPAAQQIQQSRHYDLQQQQLQQEQNQKKQSFWKKLGFKGKARR